MAAPSGSFIFPAIPVPDLSSVWAVMAQTKRKNAVNRRCGDRSPYLVRIQDLVAHFDAANALTEVQVYTHNPACDGWKIHQGESHGTQDCATARAAGG